MWLDDISSCSDAQKRVVQAIAQQKPCDTHDVGSISPWETHFLFRKKKKSNNHSIIIFFIIYFSELPGKMKILTITYFMSEPPHIPESLCNRNSKHTHTKKPKDASMQAFTSHSTSDQNLKFHSTKP